MQFSRVQFSTGNQKTECVDLHKKLKNISTFLDSSLLLAGREPKEGDNNSVRAHAPKTMSPPSAWPRELAVEARRTLLAMPVALNDAVSAGDFPGALLDSREGIYVASLFVAALVPFVRRVFVELVAEVREKEKRERE